jgi:transcriptional repressor NrdR
MFCPKCKHENTKVIDSRNTSDNKSIRRRRECESCAYRFTTFEVIATANFLVVKKDGSREPYNRAKLIDGIWKACQKRKITESQIESLLNELEEIWSARGKEVPSTIIGEGIMEKLRSLDEVAYIRFASVYRQFKDIETFKSELNKLFE